MAKKEKQDELEDKEIKPHAQASANNAEAVKKGRAKKISQDEDEEEVTPETRARAQEELRAAIKRVQTERQKKG